MASGDGNQAGLNFVVEAAGVEVCGWMDRAGSWIVPPPLLCPWTRPHHRQMPILRGQLAERLLGFLLGDPSKGPDRPESFERWTSIFFTGSLSGYPYRVSWQILPKVIVGICQRRMLILAQGRFCPRQILPKVIVGIFEREPIPISRQLASLAGHLFD